MIERLNLDSPRSREARTAAMIGKKGYQGMLAAIGLLLLGTALLLIMDGGHIRQTAYLLLAPALLLLMPALWYRQELQRLPPKQELKNLDDIISVELLARLKHPITPKSAWQACQKDWRSAFICNHLLLSSTAVTPEMSEHSSDMDAVWQLALKLRGNGGQAQIHSGTLTAALAIQSPHIMSLLTQRRLPNDSMVTTLAWLERLLGYIDQPKPYFGGIGRDWAAGYTPQLDQYGQNISRHVEQGSGHYHFLARTDTANVVLHALGQGSGSVAVIGEAGSGKTSLVYGLAQRLLEGGTPALRYYQIISLNASLMLSRNKNQLEHLVLVLLAEAVKAKNIILFLDDAHLFFGHGTGMLDMSQVLLPLLQNKRIKLIAAFTPADWQRLKSSNQSLANGFSAVTLSEPSQAEVLGILEDSALTIEQNSSVLVGYDAVLEAYKLSGQYSQDLAYPGKAIILLEQASGFHENRIVTAASVQKAIETTLGVQVSRAGPAEAATLLHLEDKIHERMINQKRAVNVIAAALRRGRAGVSSSKRPIGSFLFLGPTGVGKTELARSLAACYFNDEQRMIRLDMSEYQSGTDVERLLGSGADSGTSLIMAVRQQPFSVVLLDEVEKAHPNVLNLLLQLLDEGQLTDLSGRRASFRNAIIIATSNAGANDIITHIKDGKPLEEFERPLIDALISSNIFKPELVNRFDEIVLFRPLNENELGQVAVLLLAEVNKKLSEQNIIVSLSDDALRQIVAMGYDPQFGARPMRRVIQRTVEDVVATRILDGSVRPGQTVCLEAGDIRPAEH